MLQKLAQATARLTATAMIPGASFLQQILFEAVDLGSEPIRSQLEKRETQRFFADCADKILQNSRLLARHEYRGLTDTRIAALTSLIADAIDSTVDTKSVLDKQRQPVAIKDAIIARVPAHSTLDTEDQRFIEHVVTDIAKNICAFAEASPDFVPKSMSALLRNQDELKLMLSSVLSSIEEMRDSEGHFDAMAARFFDITRKNTENLEIFGLSIHSFKRKYPLETAYISLDVSEAADHDGALSSIEDFLSTGSMFAVVGGPGSGKTTLLQWLALKLSQHQLPTELHENLGGKFPVFIKLRHIDTYASLDFVSASKKTFPHLFDGIDASWLIGKANDGGVLFLIDGYDEIPKHLRGSAARWLDGLVGTYEDCSFVFTSRPTDAFYRFADELDIRQAFLESMTSKDVKSFIDYWHRAVASGIVNEEVAQRVAESSRRLKAALLSGDGVRSLATNPLMCAVLCTVSLDRNAEIPKEKHAVYTAAVDLLVNRRDAERGIVSKHYNSIKLGDRRKIFQRIARWLTLNDTLLISEARARKIIAETCAVPDREARGKADALLERSGMLSLVGSNEITFIHKQFQEFFAATSFVEEDDIGLLQKHAQDSAWAEILLLACAQMNRTQANSFMSDLVAKSGDRQLQIVAITCKEFAPNLDKEIDEQVEAMIAEVMPPRDVAEIQRLQVLGEKLIPIIKKASGTFDDRTAALCCRALIHSGSDAALTILASLAPDAGKETLPQLLLGWDYFDRDEYGGRVIANIRQPFELEIEQAPSVKFLAYAERCKSLLLVECNYEDKIQTLAYLPQSDSCENLVVAGDPWLESVLGIERLQHLKFAEIVFCENLRSIRDLASCAKLEMLRLEDSKSLESLSGLEKCKNLRHLHLQGCIGLEDITALSNCQKLEYIDFEECHGITNWRPLSNLPALREIRVPDMGALDQLPDDFRDRVEIN
ncbi:MAG: NACHT domain-containing protein [Verrucomicrobiaceae bacterium]|nr:MAG: NACHT domain-containing protein [Verrucomicrobiaceae bacterium]